MIHKTITLATISCMVISSSVCVGNNPSPCDKINSHDKDESNVGRIFKDLSNLNLVTEVKNGTGPSIKYKVSVCGNASSSDPLAAAVQTSENKDTVLGRVNDTEAIVGDSWMLVNFGSGDTINGTGTTDIPHVATILFLCNETIQGNLHFVQEHSVQVKSNISRCTMEVKTSLICPPKVVPDSSSHSFIFFSILFFIILAYFVGGALYRRFLLGAKGMEQIPHIAFWSQLVENCRMFCCRRTGSSSSSWHGDDERDDDSLLQP